MRCLLLVLSLTMSLSLATDTLSDEVLTVDSRGKELRRKGEIVDYKGDKLTLRSLSGRETKIPSASIKRVDAEWLPEHQEADQYYDVGDFERAGDLYRAAFRKEKRRWVQRRLLAKVVRCQANTGREAEACKNFARLVSDDPDTVYFSEIPLTWQTEPTPPVVAKLVAPWMNDTANPAKQLMAASWLSVMNQDAKRILKELARVESGAVAELALAQYWRSELMSLDESRLKFWEDRIEQMPLDLRAGSYYLLGLSYAKFDKRDDASLAFLRLPSQYPDQVALNVAALLKCGETMQKASRNDEAALCYRRLAELRVSEPVTTLALKRLNDLP